MSFSCHGLDQIIPRSLKPDLEPEKIMPGRDREEEPLDVENRCGIEIRISSASDTNNLESERDCLTGKGFLAKVLAKREYFEL